MTTAQRTWLSPQARTRLETELAELMTHHPVDDDARDRDEQIVEAWLARKARIRQIHELLSNSVVGELPPDDGVAEPGMVLTVRYDDSGDTETFLLGVRGVEDADIEVYSVQSPLGQALAGARAGEQRSFALPNGGTQPVTLVSAVPYGAHIAAD